MVYTRIDWVREHCRLLRAISAEFRQTRPFGGLTIGTGIHLEAKTAALLLTLRDGGARLVSTGNLNTTQPDAVETLRAEGITVIGGPTRDREVHSGYLDEVLAAKPDLLLDNGGDLFARYLDRPYEGLLGGTEETTSGRMRLEPLRGQLKRPILVINDSPIKQFAENEHAVGATCSTWPARGRSATPSRQWISDSRCKPGAWRRSPLAGSTPPVVSSRCLGPSTRPSPPAISIVSIRRPRLGSPTTAHQDC